MIHIAFESKYFGGLIELCNLLYEVINSKKLFEKYHDVFNAILLNLAASKEAVPIWKFVNLIEQFGANIHIKNADGMTPFLLCSKENKLEAMKYFIEKGANINDLDAQNRNARQIAEDEGHLDIVKYIDDGFVVKK
jgi:ankyrin repeat protein